MEWAVRGGSGRDCIFGLVREDLVVWIGYPVAGVWSVFCPRDGVRLNG